MNRWLLASLALTAAAFVACLGVYFGLSARLPEQIPVHWGFSGAPDRFVPKDQALLSLLTPALVMLGRWAWAGCCLGCRRSRSPSRPFGRPTST